MTMHPRLRSLVIALGLVAGVGMAPSSSPVSADSSACTWDGHSGCALFKSRGEHFYVCDRHADGRSVTVAYAYKNTNGNVVHRTATNYWGSGTCRDVNRSIREGAKVAWTVCLSKYGRPGGTKMDVLESTCGPRYHDVIDWA
jgi:hypothetical protein